jgi:hypothetical protein
MVRLSNVLALAMILIGTPLANAAEALPTYDYAKNCKEQLGYVLGIGQTEAACVSDEQQARQQLSSEWNSFSPAEKASCIRETNIGTPSYVELQTCLQMTRWAGHNKDK